MNNKRLFISSCGTSILTNGASKDERSLLIKNANKSENQIEPEDLYLINNRIQSVKDEVKQMTFENAIKKSAELNSLIKFYDFDLNQPQDYHILIKTDTFLGKKTAEIINSFLERYKIVVEVLDIPDLKALDLKYFRSALSDIVKELYQRLPEYRKKNYEIIFNLTGGFKSVQGFLQVLAMFYADKSIYIFESGELLEIPRIPIIIDEVEIFEKNILKFRNLSKGVQCDVKHIPKIFIAEDEGKYALSPWGDIAWENAKNILYKKQLFGAPTFKIIYSDAFLKDIKNLNGDRIKELNKKIDDLMQYLVDRKSLKSLSFKSILKDVKPKSTHEFYANSDEGKRVYCHYENDILILDEYGNHL